MVYGYAFLASCGMIPGLGSVAVYPLRLLLGGLLALAEYGEAVPLAAYRLPAPWPWVIPAYLLFLGGRLLPRRFRKVRAAAGAGFAVSLSMLILPLPRPPHAGVTVSFMDVGHGDAILVRRIQGPLAVAPDRVEVLVVGENEHNIRPPPRRARRRHGLRLAGAGHNRRARHAGQARFYELASCHRSVHHCSVAPR